MPSDHWISEVTSLTATVGHEAYMCETASSFWRQQLGINLSNNNNSCKLMLVVWAAIMCFSRITLVVVLQMALFTRRTLQQQMEVKLGFHQQMKEATPRHPASVR